jgi:hypothetical protein
MQFSDTVTRVGQTRSILKTQSMQNGPGVPRTPPDPIEPEPPPAPDPRDPDPYPRYEDEPPAQPID